MEPATFESLVADAIQAVPERFRQKLENVAFVIETFHRQPRPAERPIAQRGVLLGLYQGVPYGHRGQSYSGALPDKITIFQDTIEQVAGHDPEQIQRIVSQTVQHEIAHYFGMDEGQVRRWERQRRRR